MIKTLYPTFQRWSEKGSVYLVSDTHFDDSDCKYMDPNWPSPEEYLENTLKKITKNDTLIHLGDVGDVSYMKNVKGHKVLIMGNHDTGRTNYERKIIEYSYEFPSLQDAQIAKKSGIIDYLWLDQTKASYKVYKNNQILCNFMCLQDVEAALQNNLIDYYELDRQQSWYKGFTDNHLFDEVYEGPLFIADKIVLSHEPICVTAGITGEPIAFNIHGHDHSGEYYSDDYHLNIAANVIGYQLINLSDVIKLGLIKSIPSIHRCIIDRATKRKYG